MLKKNINLVLRVFVAIILITAKSNVLADNISSAFDKRNNYKNKTTLGDPASMRNFTNHQGDVSNLQNLNDSALTSHGTDSLRNSSHGKTLQNAEEKKIDSIERHKINPNNPWLKNSFKIEEEPLSKTGGRQLSATEKITKTTIKKSCIEGVDFNIDVGLELVLEVEEEEVEKASPWEAKKIALGGPWIYHTHRGWLVPIQWTSSRYGLLLRADNPVVQDEITTHIALNENVELDAVRNVSYGWRGVGSTIHVDSNLHSFYKYNIYYELQKKEKIKQLVEKAEYWQVSTEGTEKLADSNECHEIGRVCLKSGVKTFFGKYDISRPCWYEKISYRCQSEPKNGCDHLIKQDCRLKDSECEYKIGSICLRWKRNYLCGGKKKELEFSLADSPIYCLGGDCHTPTIEENQDFANVGYLAAVNAAGKDCVKESNGVCKNPITVFPGQAESCKKIVTGFINCCSSMKGWGKNVNLSRCSGGEKGLALKRDKGLCHTIGTYCSERDPVFNKCLVKKTSHCCFGSKLARIFHEQGRKQHGIGWGSEERPNCRPLTLEELRSLDFSKFDMEELFEGLLSKGKSNKNKGFPNLVPGEVPEIQKEHMKTNSTQGKEIRRGKGN